MKRFVFHPLDLLAPWLVCLASAGICVWAAVKASDNVGRIISLVVGAVFLSAIGVWYLVRASSRNPDFTVGGMGVCWGKVNRPFKNVVEVWVKDLTSFWQGKTVLRTHDPMSGVTITPFLIKRALNGLLVVCYDTDHFSFWGRMVTGYAFGRDIALGYKGADMAYTASLFRHEASHQILDKAGVPWDEARHHKIFQDMGLGA